MCKIDRGKELPMGSSFLLWASPQRTQIHLQFPQNPYLQRRLPTHAQRAKFLEQAFDWDLMSQAFYPYYWSNRCNWKNLFQSQDSIDGIFQAFLQSGMSRVVAPIRPGFEDAVLYFQETGEVWNGTGIAFDSDDEIWLSIADEMNETKVVIEGEWETIVPSSLTIVQKDSALLDETGLPCCDQLELETSSIKPSTNILSLLTTAEVPK